MSDIQASRTGIFMFLLLSVVLMLPIASGFYKYFYVKDYIYLIESKCDPSNETCFIRDCSIIDECPPNQYSEYKMFNVTASDFEKCNENSCEKECKNNLIECISIPCGASEEDICSTSEDEDIL